MDVSVLSRLASRIGPASMSVVPFLLGARVYFSVLLFPSRTKE